LPVGFVGLEMQIAPILLDLSQQAVDDLASELNNEYKVNALGFAVDITNEESIQNNAELIFNKFGHIDGLVNNAANNPKVEDNSKVNFSRLENFPLDLWHRDIEVGLTRYIATYWPEQNVRCNAICPGGVENGQPNYFLKEIVKRIPMRRMAQSDEYQGTLLWMLSDASSYLNGAIVPVDGGRTTW